MIAPIEIKSADPNIFIDDFPQLRLIAWSQPHTKVMTESDAFGLYERNWRFIDENTMSAAERALIARLAIKFGEGFLNV